MTYAPDETDLREQLYDPVTRVISGSVRPARPGIYSGGETNKGAAESSVTAFFSKLADTWNTNDGAAFADFFTEDGSLINPFDERADGRVALTPMYTEYLGGMLHGTTTSITLTTLRAIRG